MHEISHCQLYQLQRNYMFKEISADFINKNRINKEILIDVLTSLIDIRMF